VLESTHRFTVMLVDAEGAVIDSRQVRRFPQIEEDLLFEAVRSGRANDGRPPQVRLEPAWDGEKLAGLAATAEGITKTYPPGIFSYEVYDMMHARGLLEREESEMPEYRLRLEIAPEEEAAPAAKRLKMSVSRAPFPFSIRTLESFGIVAEGGVRCYVSARVLEELRAETARSLDAERADFLTGHLVRQGSEVAVVMRNRIPASGATGTPASVSFSPLTFHAAQQENAGRGSGDVICGWHHNHPPACGRECRNVGEACAIDTVFLSLADRCVFRASFPAPYMVGLISGKGAHQSADRPIFRAYGWKDGLVGETRFSVFEEQR
jgi:hypothetical protein